MHKPVLYQEVLHYLQPRPGQRFVDGTVGGGGHAFGILQATQPDGLLLGLDVDASALEVAEQNLKAFRGRYWLIEGSYRDLARHLAQIGWNEVDGVLLDLGVSSLQLEAPERGFSFRAEGPLDMRFDRGKSPTAADLVNNLSQEELAKLLFRYGEERFATQIARAIVSSRPILTTTQLAELVSRVVGRHCGGIHPATRTFQALRIVVNEELDALKEGLPQAIDALKPRGRLVVISFHSLEDRLVKNCFQIESRDCLCPPKQPICTCGHRARVKVLTPKPVRPSAQEVKSNPRARSARLRAAEKLARGE
ncbi:MAG: 16S rRNA (cytosine(1402)-N(4))-methyltransferase RsmH [Anaerolineales bacterium]|nr:16S rRNA (cytosine(1402)-N(4))-methyltransferase RsmH [Anaerolineales bacterium]MDW8160487.1 16S rRNA (cytosine(1402)-N(4))-methyltransferase RsmH [Anaerolineales bacterium]